ncbi:MAG: hypothetical protein AAF552_08850 [Pseudomonadota bacterium]
MSIRTVVLLAAVLLVGGCEAEQPISTDGGQPLPVIQTYEVEAGTAREIATVLQELIQDLDARARALGDNLVVVSAPASLQQGVGSLIKEFERTPEAAPVRVRLHYWLVGGKASDQVQVPDTLGSIADALTTLTDAAGPLAFRRIDYLQQVLASGRGAGSVHGAVMNAESRVAVSDGNIGVDLNLRKKQHHVGAYVELADGETVLLAQMGADGEEDETLLFVVRAETF